MKQTCAMAVLMVMISLMAMAQETKSESPYTEYSPDHEEGEILRYLEGSWKTEYDWPGMGTVTELVDYTFNDTGTTLQMKVRILQGEQEVDTSKGWLKIDADTGNLMVEVTSDTTGDTVSGTEFKRNGAIIWAEGTRTNMLPRFRVRMDYGDSDALQMTWYMPEGESWVEALDLTYHRVK